MRQTDEEINAEAVDWRARGLIGSYGDCDAFKPQRIKVEQILARLEES